MIVKNIPGGGSTKGANFFAQRAKPNGSNYFRHFWINAISLLIRHNKRVRYDYNKWHVVLGSPTGGVVYISPKFKVKKAKRFTKIERERV